MIISIQWQESYFSISPDPAIVIVGTPIEWVVNYFGAPMPGLLWTVYFDHGSPFTGKEFSTFTGGGHSAGHFLSAGPAFNSGFCKYGVKVQNQATGSVIGDDDPHLVVRQP